MTNEAKLSEIIRNKPAPSKREAQKRLRELGILDKNNNIAPAFRGVFVKKEAK